MKKAKILLCCLLLATLSLYAQTQQGYVKTLGRPDKKGDALSGVTVRVKGEHNYVVSGDDGTFFMLMAGKKNGDAYTLQQVQKDGYELNENDMVGRQLAFSDKVPLTIVMVSSEQLEADKQRIENNAFAVAQRNYQAQRDLLEQQLAANEITIEKYQKEIQQLKDKFEKYQSLIDGLAEHYAHTDYDALNEKDREISLCIENGELDRADSLIGTLFDPVDVLKRNKEALSQIESQLGQAYDILAQAYEDMAAVLKQQEKDAEYLFQLYTIALSKFDNDKARYYIETRAELDTTNPGWQFNAGCFVQEQNDFAQARKYFSRALNGYKELAKDNPKTYEPYLASTLNNLAILYKNTQHVTESEQMYLEALESYRRLSKSKPERLPYVAGTLNNLGLLYSDTQRFEESEAMYLEALKIRRRLAKTKPDTYEPSLALTLNNLAILYKNTQRFAESEALLMEALEIQKRLAKKNPQAYESDLAMTLNNLAVLYANTSRQGESETWHREVLEIYRRMAKENPKAYEPVLATTLNNLAIFYKNSQHFTESEKLHSEALEICKRLAKEDPEAYEPDVALTLNHLAALYYSTQRFEESETARMEALAIYRRLAAGNPQHFEREVAVTLNNLAILYENTHRLPESEALHLEALEIQRRLAKDNPQAYEPDVAVTLDNLADLYFNTQRLTESEALYLEALDVFRRLAKETPQVYEPNLVTTLSSLAILYYKSQRFPESEAMHLEALEIYRRLAAGNPQAYHPRLATTLYSIGLLRWQQEQYPQAVPAFEEALALYRSLALNDSSYKKWYEKNLNMLTQLYQMTDEHEKFLAVNGERLALLKKHFQNDANFYQRDYVRALGDQSLQSNLSGRWGQSEQYAREVLSIDSTCLWIHTDLAASLLLQGKYSEAEAIYRQYKDDLKESFLQNLNVLETVGVVPEERKTKVEEIRKMLNE